MLAFDVRARTTRSTKEQYETHPVPRRSEEKPHFRRNGPLLTRSDNATALTLPGSRSVEKGRSTAGNSANKGGHMTFASSHHMRTQHSSDQSVDTTEPTGHQLRDLRKRSVVTQVE